MTPHRCATVPRSGRVASLLLAAATAASASLILGCAVTVGPPVLATGVVVEEPVVEGPVIDGGVAIDVEPAIDQRVYVYDAGFPPGTYLYGGYYWYGGYRYPQDVFINGYVATNIRGGLYVNVAENRRVGAFKEQQHRAEFARTGGKRAPVAAHAAARAPQQARPAPRAPSGKKR
jgi:hypothetical protein